MKVIVAGGSGFIGQALVTALRGKRHDVIVLTRRATAEVESARTARWDGRQVGPWAAHLRGATAVVNLAGESIGGRRWTKRRRRGILASRLDSTRALVHALELVPADARPRVLVNASGIDYFGNVGDTAVDEGAPAGSSFLAEVCVAWEAEAARAEELGVRVVLMRTPLVLGRSALALKLLAFPFRLFVGGRLGDGRQWFPWVHLDDIVALYERAIRDDALHGPLNAVAPDVRRQTEAARELGRVLRRPSWLPAPAWVLRLALGRQADLLLHGQRARSRKLHKSAFRFRDLRGALDEALL